MLRSSIISTLTSFTWKRMKTVRENFYRNLQVSCLKDDPQKDCQGEEFTTKHLRIAVCSWNVAGRTPPTNLNLTDLLDCDGLVDIYIMGFQEVVPLNVWNVCFLEDSEPANQWQILIEDAMNRLGCGSDGSMMESNNLILPSDEESLTVPLISLDGNVPYKLSGHSRKQASYVRVASKQMVGIHISIWVRRTICKFVHSLSVSCVGVGLMGCLGNKGSIAVSMKLHQTSFCFICSHLTSGIEKEHEERRNSDAAEILKRTYFPLCNTAARSNLESVWGHDQIFWLGDFNYRLDLKDNEIRYLVAEKNWTCLFEKDQLRKHSMKGYIFEGWHEGIIDFPPTYKYEFGSNQYAGENLGYKDKQRPPAWCDRVLWRGRGMKLLSYRRAEYTFSDHRPVIAIFSSEVLMPSSDQISRANKT
ncbi:hypothetical protein KP509_18G058600 [Ceratopteris richardii]|uniref:Inositol polyphosphate-related phosphatase domain-containing protein n=1 Tax=Ceratopteris richardii TaxID=49495 RepID=A0A8T2SQN9_CERRI|nr:hypothetical protein KP509_18G058600 [Ceratopteris richardii]